MRLFIAINLSEQERADLFEAAAPLRERDLPVRWVPRENLHVTLKFLGEIRSDSVEAVERALRRVTEGTEPFDAELAGFGAFPTIRRPRVIWAGLDPTPAVRCLKQDVEWALSEVGYDRETRAFHPHVTLGRAEKDGGAGAFRGLDDAMADMSHSTRIRVLSVELMRSHFSRSGSRYSVVSSTTLGGAS